MQYQQDFDDFMPAAGYSSDLFQETAYSTGELATPNRYKWMDAIYPYAKNEQVFVCPSARPRPVGDESSTQFIVNSYRYRNGSTPFQTNAFPYRYGSYAINWIYRDYSTSNSYIPKGPAGARQSLLATPSTTIFVVDSNGGFFGGLANATTTPNDMPIRTDTSSPIMTNPGGAFTIWSAVVARHLDFTNVLYCDGHVKAQQLEDINQTKTLKYTTWGTTAAIFTDWTIQDD